MTQIPPNAGSNGRRSGPARECLRTARAGPIGTFVSDSRGRLRRFDPVFANLLQLRLRPRRACPLAIDQLLGPNALEELTRGGTVGFLATDCMLPGGRTILLRVRRSTEGLRGWIEDVTAQRRSESRLRFAAGHDPLTGLLNRRALHQRLPEAIATLQYQPASLVFIDLDGFKQINDVFGHAAGDSVLRQFATRLRETVASHHLAARIGGDEFVIVLPGSNRREAAAWVDQLRRRVSRQPFIHFEHEFALRFCVGVAQVRPDASPGDVLSVAEGRCREAKTAEGPPARSEFEESGSAITRAFQSATVGIIDASRFHIQVQPVFLLASDLRIIGYDCLLRLLDETGRLRMPAEFLPMMQRAGLAARIDLWVMTQALQWLTDARHSTPDQGFCVVKLSAAALHDNRFQREAIAMLREAPAGAQRLRVEVRARYVMQRSPAVANFIEGLADCGTRPVISGFGELPVWMPRLDQLRSASLKLEAALVTGPGHSQHGAQAVVDQCRANGISTCATRIESADALKAARACQFEMVQGFFLARPKSLWNEPGPPRLPQSRDARSARGLSSVVTSPGRPVAPDASTNPPECSPPCPVFVSSTAPTGSSP